MIESMEMSIVSLVVCPSCTGSLVETTEAYVCQRCSKTYPVVDGLPNLTIHRGVEGGVKERMRDYWDSGWVKRHVNDPRFRSRDTLLRDIGAAEFRNALMEENSAVEMDEEFVKGKKVLEVGCGQAVASCIFALRGARVVAVDLTSAAAVMARTKFKLLGIPQAAYQADAERLPFGDAVFDIVYSNGVLHHTPDTQKAVDEVYRVLKPGGHAVVLLYARRSFNYWIRLFLIEGLIRGEIFKRGSSWLGPATEKAWDVGENSENPITKVYSGTQMRELFRRFQVLRLRKHGFYWSELIPLFWKFIPGYRFMVGRTLNLMPGRLEILIGRFAGFSLTITVQKPTV